MYGLIENKSWFYFILLVLQSLGPQVYLSHYTSWVVHWASLGAFLNDDVQVNIRMACSHGELWFCPVGWKFTKPGAGLWWTLFLILPFLCPLRCKVTSAHQREAPYSFHLMFLPPPPNTHPPPLTHIYTGQRIQFTFEKIKINWITRPICLAGVLALCLSLCSRKCLVGWLLWCEMKGKVCICCSKTLGATI